MARNPTLTPIPACGLRLWWWENRQSRIDVTKCSAGVSRDRDVSFWHIATLSTVPKSMETEFGAPFPIAKPAQPLPTPLIGSMPCCETPAINCPNSRNPYAFWAHTGYCVAAWGSSNVESRAEEYRRLAGDCLALVKTVATEKARRTLIEMARVWTRLADETARPLVQQQQQQVQPKKDE
jgi:hypothetical protein